MTQKEQRAWHILDAHEKSYIEKHFLTETTGSAWPFPVSVLLAPVSTVLGASWVFPVVDAEVGVGGVLETSSVLMCQRRWVPGWEGSGFQIKLCMGSSHLTLGGFLLGVRLSPPDKVGEQGSPLCWQNMPKGAGGCQRCP